MQEQNCTERMSVMIPDDQDITVFEHMTQLNESQREVQRPTVYLPAEIADNHWLLERENYV